MATIIVQEVGWTVETRQGRESMQDVCCIRSAKDLVTRCGASKGRNFTVYSTLSKEAAARTRWCGMVPEQAHTGRVVRAAPCLSLTRAGSVAEQTEVEESRLAQGLSREGPRTAKSTRAFLLASLKDQAPGESQELNQSLKHH